jgi:hypothetical protein
MPEDVAHWSAEWITFGLRHRTTIGLVGVTVIALLVAFRSLRYNRPALRRERPWHRLARWWHGRRN